MIGRVGREEAPAIVASDIKRIEEIYKAIKAINPNVSTIDQRTYLAARKT